jgi:ABC-type phosphate transport system substrate-binding protein
VFTEGVNVSYTPNGDSAGRQDFANRVSDFSVTADGYQGFDPITGVSDTSNGRSYVYLPVSAGGTSFPYQIRSDGHQVKNLRLSGETLAKIFTNRITNWDDPEITADNNGVQLPNLPIIPVVQSEGSGATQQLTQYFASEYPSIWTPFAGQAGPTEYFPRQGDQIAQTGSTGAMNYISSSAANGAIGYVEYSYPLAVLYPVAKVLNNGGYYTLPTQYNVAVALEKAQINNDPSSPDYLLQTLTNVYTDTDPRTYPLSSYVYFIEPIGGSTPRTNPATGQTIAADKSENTAKRQALADFEYYSICQGQSEIGAIGYSPLPVNLVEAAFGQVQQLAQADPGVNLDNLNIQTCHEPTFVPGQPNLNYLTTIAPLPPACDKAGAGPCAAGVTPNGLGKNPKSSGSYSGGAQTPGSSGTGSSSSTGSQAGSSGGPSGGGGGGTSPGNSGGGTSPGNSRGGTSPGRSGAGTSPRRARARSSVSVGTGAPSSGIVAGAGVSAAGGTVTSQPAPVVTASLSLGVSPDLWVSVAVAGGLLLLFGAPVLFGLRRRRQRGVES